MNRFHSLRRALRALAMGGILLFNCLNASGQVATDLSIQALSNSPAPGTSGLKWTNVGLPSIAQDGEVIFRGFLNNTGGLQQIGLWRGSGGTYALVARSDMPAPGAGSGAIFDEPLVFGLRAANGTAPKPLAFQALVNTGSNIVRSIYSAVGGSLTKVALVGDPAPGGQTYGSLEERRFFSADDGSLMFLGTAAGLETVWYSAGGQAAIVAQQGQPVPNVSGATFNEFQRTGLGISGGANPKIFFLVSAANPNPINRRSGGGLYLASPGQAPVAYYYFGDAAPGVPGAFLGSTLDVDLNSGGDVVYSAFLQAIDPLQSPPPVDDTNNEAIYFNNTLLVRKGEPSGAGFDFAAFGSVVVNDAGQVAFFVGASAVCLIDGTERTVLAKIGDQAPGAPAGVTFTSFSNISQGRLQLNNLGQVLFLAFTSDGKSGLWCTDPDGTLRLIIRVDSQIQVAPGDVRTVTGFGSAINRLNEGTGGHDGRARAINDAGQIVFSVLFSGNSTAIVEVGGSSTPPDPTPTNDTAAAHRTALRVGDPVSTFTGELFGLESVDLNLGGPMPLRFTRYYASKLASDGNVTGALGRNRLHNFEAKLTLNGNSLTIILSDGRAVTFTKAGNAWTLAGRKDVPFELVQTSDSFLLGDPHSQRIWTFDSTTSRLMAIADGRGNAHTLGYSLAGKLTTVSDGLGRTLTLGYDGGDHLASVSDGTRAVSFTYDGANLATAANPLMQTTTYTYDASGRLLSTQRPRGNTPYSQAYSNDRVSTQTEEPVTGITHSTQLSYNTSTRVTTLTDPTGEARVHRHSASGEATEFTDEEIHTVTLGSDATGRRGSVTDRLGRTTVTVHDVASGKPTRITAADGSVTTFAYAARKHATGLIFHDLTKVVLPDGGRVSFAYDASGNLLSAIDQAGKKTRFAYNGRGQVLTVTNPTGGISTFTYDSAGNLATSKDSDTGITTFVHDGFSRLTKVTHPDTTHFDIAYNAADRVTSITDEAGNVFGFTYDANGNVTSITDPTTAIAQYGYDALDRAVTFTNRLGKMSSVAFDARNWVGGVTDELSQSTLLARDKRQRLASVKDAGNAKTLFEYNDEAELTAVTDPIGHTTRYARNKLGRVLAVVDPLGNAAQVQRDALQRIVQIVDPIGRATALRYDKRGLLVGTARDGAGTATYARDAAGRLVKMTDPNGRSWTYSYTPAGRLVATKDPLGRATGFSHDSTGQLATVTFAGGESCAISRNGTGDVTKLEYSEGPTLDFAYDGMRRLTATNGVVLTRDAEGRITNSLQDGVNYTATYDDAGRLIGVGYGSAFAVHYVYDSRDRLVTVTDNAGSGSNSMAFTYDDAGRVTGLTRSNGRNAIFTYDAADRLTRIQESPLFDLQYTLNAAGDVTAIDYGAPLLPSVASDTKTFAFDPAAQVKATGYSYDARGRLTAMPGLTLAWDGASRLTAIDGRTLTYNGFGEVTARAGNSPATFHYHHAIPTHPLVLEAGGPSPRYYVWTPGGTLLWSVDGNGVRFYHFDRTGSTLALSDAAGLGTDAYAYTPFGDQLAHTGPSTQPFTYIGAYGIRREGELYQMRARYYDPVTARFLSRDPAPPQLDDVRTLDPYLYALGNPTRYVDVTGASPALATTLFLFGPAGNFSGALQKAKTAMKRGKKGGCLSAKSFVESGASVAGSFSEVPIDETEPKALEYRTGNDLFDLRHPKVVVEPGYDFILEGDAPPPARPPTPMPSYGFLPEVANGGKLVGGVYATADSEKHPDFLAPPAATPATEIAVATPEIGIEAEMQKIMDVREEVAALGKNDSPVTNLLGLVTKSIFKKIFGP